MTDQWVVTLECSTRHQDEDALVAAEDALAEYDAIVAATPSLGQVTITLRVTADDDPGQIAGRLADLLEKSGVLTILGLPLFLGIDVLAAAEYERRALEFR